MGHLFRGMLLPIHSPLAFVLGVIELEVGVGLVV